MLFKIFPPPGSRIRAFWLIFEDVRPALLFCKEIPGKRTAVSLFFCILFALCLPACRTAPLPRLNLAEPGWTIREGQAVWKRDREAPELAGELLVATAAGRTFVQFSKSPFPMVVAQTTTNRWQVEIPTQGKRYSAPGRPPVRLIWLYLAGLLEGQTPPKHWHFQRMADDRWRVENHQTGESIEGYLESPRK